MRVKNYSIAILGHFDCSKLKKFFRIEPFREQNAYNYDIFIVTEDIKKNCRKISNYVLDKLVIVTDSEHIGYIDDDVRAYLQKSGFVHFDLALACEINNLIFVHSPEHKLNIVKTIFDLINPVKIAGSFLEVEQLLIYDKLSKHFLIEFNKKFDEYSAACGLKNLKLFNDTINVEEAKRHFKNVCGKELTL